MKILPLGLALAVSFILTGCSGLGTQSSNTDSSTSSTSTTSTTSSTTSSTTKTANGPTNYEITEDDNLIKLSADYDGHFSIREEYRFEENKLSKVKTYIILGSSKSILEVADYLGGAIKPSDCEDVSDTKYLYSSDKSFFLGDIEQVEYTKVLSKLKSLSTYKPAAETPSVNEAGSSLLIREYSKTTLLLESSSMRISVGDTKQIAIAQCPEGYADDLIFVSSNPRFAKVDAYGNVTGISNGVVTVNVSIHGAAVYQSIMIYVT